MMMNRVDVQHLRGLIIEADLASHPGHRFLTAHQAALGLAAIALQVRAPARLSDEVALDPWRLLARVAPELAEWATYFGNQQVIAEALMARRTGVTTRQADDLIRDAELFAGVIESWAQRQLRSQARAKRQPRSQHRAQTRPEVGYG